MTTSSDGYLTVTTNATYASVLVVVNFTGATGISAGYAVSVTRQATDLVTGISQTVTVRGLDKIRAPGGVVAGFDAEAPQGVICTYKATAFNAAGTTIVTSTTATASITAQTADLWIKNLITPVLSAQVNIEQSPDWNSGRNQGLFAVIGRSDPVVKSDVRLYPSGTLVAATTTQAQKVALDTLLNSAGPYLLQFVASSNEQDRFVMIGPDVQQRNTPVAPEAYRTWQLPLATLARPSTTSSRVSVPGHTYADSLVRWPLYSNRSSTYLTRVTT